MSMELLTGPLCVKEKRNHERYQTVLLGGRENIDQLQGSRPASEITQMFWFCVHTVSSESHCNEQDSSSEEGGGEDEGTQTQNLTVSRKEELWLSLCLS